MSWIVKNLWLIPALPLAAAALIAVAKRPCRRFAAAMTIGTMGCSFLLALCAFAHTHPFGHSETVREVFNFNWLQFAGGTDGILKLGWVLDPLSAIMLVMVTFVGLLIFIYSVGYMAHDENFTRFFCFLSLFAAAMLGLVISNNLLLLFICWELVGLASYLLIGFWYHKPSAAAAAKKAFITTRIGDVVFFLGILWLYASSGTLLFYDNGHGCMENASLSQLVGLSTVGGMALTTGIALMIFCGAVGKSGQVPLHVWLPDAMEGPTPVSALIHAATMVAAGVFLIARVYPLLNPDSVAGVTGGSAAALQVVTWVGAITAVFAALTAVAQTDIKRILAYSTVSQLGFMFMGLGAGGVAVGMFHLITHAFFKALLFLGAGSVIHGCHEEQDIRHMGGLKKFMPVTFATYAIGMMALSGVPLLFSGFWSKDKILDSLLDFPNQGPFCLGVIGALLTAFYMTRQMSYVFAGEYRGKAHSHTAHADGHGHDAKVPHESPRVMTVPLVILAVFAVVLGFFGTPAWPWFTDYLSGYHSTFEPGKLFETKTLVMMGVSVIIVAAGIRTGWALYGNRNLGAESQDILERMRPAVIGDLFTLFRNKFYVDEFYEATVIKLNAWWARFCNGLDHWVWNGLVLLVSYAVVGLSWVNDSFDKFVINLGFDRGCGGVRGGGGLLSRLQNGRVQNYLRVIGVALAVLLLLLMWGCSAS